MADQLFLEPSLWGRALCFISQQFSPNALHPAQTSRTTSLTVPRVFLHCLSSPSPVIALRLGPGLSIFVFPNWGRDSKEAIINVHWMNECMNLEHEFSPSWSWQFLHETGPTYTKDAPPSRLDSERIDFSRVSPVEGPLLPGHLQMASPCSGSQKPPAVTLFSSTVCLQS